MTIATPSAADLHMLIGLMSVLLLAGAVDVSLSDRNPGHQAMTLFAVVLDGACLLFALFGVIGGSAPTEIWMVAVGAVILSLLALIGGLLHRMNAIYAARKLSD